MDMMQGAEWGKPEVIIVIAYALLTWNVTRS